MDEMLSLVTSSIFTFSLLMTFHFLGATTLSITTFWIMTLSVTLKHDLSIKTLVMSVVGLTEPSGLNQGTLTERQGSIQMTS
jgi:hypothetical protein